MRLEIETEREEKKSDASETLLLLFAQAATVPCCAQSMCAMCIMYSSLAFLFVCFQYVRRERAQLTYDGPRELFTIYKYFQINNFICCLIFIRTD